MVDAPPTRERMARLLRTLLRARPEIGAARTELRLSTGNGKTQSAISLLGFDMPDDKPWFQFSNAGEALLYRLNHDEAFRKASGARLARILGDPAEFAKLQEGLNTPGKIKSANLEFQAGFDKARANLAAK